MNKKNIFFTTVILLLVVSLFSGCIQEKNEQKQQELQGVEKNTEQKLEQKQEKTPEPLTIEIKNPKDGFETKKQNVTIIGTVSRASKVLVNGIETLVIDNEFTWVVDLDFGSNTISIEALALDGAKAEKTLTVVRSLPDKEAPEQESFEYSYNLSVGGIVGVNVDTTAFTFGMLPPGGESMRIITLTNYQSIPMLVSMRVEGDQSQKWVLVPKDFVIAPGEVSNASITVKVPGEIKKGDYKGKIIISIKQVK